MSPTCLQEETRSARCLLFHAYFSTIEFSQRFREIDARQGVSFPDNLKALPMWNNSKVQNILAEILVDVRIYSKEHAWETSKEYYYAIII